jgi:hypothetical protein
MTPPTAEPAWDTRGRVSKVLLIGQDLTASQWFCDRGDEPHITAGRFDFRYLQDISVGICELHLSTWPGAAINNVPDANACGDKLQSEPVQVICV